jgi:hypothetical protein
MEEGLHHSSPRHYMEVSGKLYAPGASPPEKNPPVIFGQEVGWAPQAVWTMWRREISPDTAGTRAQVVQPVACRYTD